MIKPFKSQKTLDSYLYNFTILKLTQALSCFKLLNLVQIKAYEFV
jgi:hypothetical protein